MFGIPFFDGKWYPKDDVETAKAIVKIRPEVISTTFYTPIPGSYLYEFCVKNDLLLSSTSRKLGLRFPSESKIKGVDYKFLNQLLSSITPKKGTLYSSFVEIMRKARLHNVLKDLLVKRQEVNIVVKLIKSLETKK